MQQPVRAFYSLKVSNNKFLYFSEKLNKMSFCKNQQYKIKYKNISTLHCIQSVFNFYYMFSNNKKRK